jgi:hypothetical protein
MYSGLSAVEKPRMVTGAGKKQGKCDSISGSGVLGTRIVNPVTPNFAYR